MGGPPVVGGSITVTITGAPEEVAGLLRECALCWPAPDTLVDDALPETPNADLDTLNLALRLRLRVAELCGMPPPSQITWHLTRLLCELRPVYSECPYCGARRGRWCISRSGRAVAAHAARRTAPAPDPTRGPTP